MAEVLALIQDYLVPVVGCFGAGTLVYDRGGPFVLWGLFACYHPSSEAGDETAVEEVTWGCLSSIWPESIAL